MIDVGVKNGYLEINVSNHISSRRPSRHTLGKGHDHKFQKETNPVTKSKQSSSAYGRAGSNAQSARPSAELDQSSSADGRAGSNARPARPSIKLDRTHDQLGHPPSWTKPVQLGGWPSWIELSGSNALDRTRSCFASIGGTVGTLPFRNHKNSFSQITFGLIV